MVGVFSDFVAAGRGGIIGAVLLDFVDAARGGEVIVNLFGL